MKLYHEQSKDVQAKLRAAYILRNREQFSPVAVQWAIALILSKLTVASLFEVTEMLVQDLDEFTLLFECRLLYYRASPIEYSPVNVHHFDTTGQAYDMCQWNEEIRPYDLLVVENSYSHRRIIGLAWTWPYAVTKEQGHLHQLANPAEEVKDQPKALQAVKLALTLGLIPIHELHQDWQKVLTDFNAVL